jgi:hypothetical protein
VFVTLSITETCSRGRLPPPAKPHTTSRRLEQRTREDLGSRFLVACTCALSLQPG